MVLSWKIDPPKIEDPALLAFTKINFTRARFEHMLKKEEEENDGSIWGEEKITRLGAREDLIGADANVGAALWKNYLWSRGHTILEYLYNVRSVIQFDLPGTIILDSIGRRHVFVFHRTGGNWDYGFRLLNRNWNVHMPSLVFRKPVGAIRCWIARCFG
jgi:hypothetical protein